LLLIGIVVFIIGANAFLNAQVTEERLESLIQAGSSVPFVNYDESWMYLGLVPTK